MVNYQNIINKQKPDSTPTPYGLRVAFTAPAGIKKIADGVPSGDKWATGGNLVGFLTNGKYVECSITYVTSIGGVSPGWKFWYVYSGDSSGTYQSITDPTGDGVALTLQNVNGIWKARFQNTTDQTSVEYTITNAPNVTLSLTISSNRLMMESSNPDCPDYIDFNQIDFDNFRYLQSNGSFTNQVPTTVGSSVSPTLTGCIAITQSTDRIYHT